jgi:hypothetical protein
MGLPKWRFDEATPRHKSREAMQGAFFEEGSTVRSLVREAIQNSLDAKRPEIRGPVRVRIYVSGQIGAVPSDKMKHYLDGSWEHFLAEDNGLNDKPSLEEACTFITFEDFETKGLNGDITQYHISQDRDNPFYLFLRAEGQTDKGRTDRGRWGVGKFVFPKASRIKTFFAVTVRSGDRRQYLVGQAILKSHKVDNVLYTPDSWFGETGEADLDLPCDDPEFIHKFCKDFNLQRQDEAGLSIVVPYCEAEVETDEVLKSVVREYFYPILDGSLHVTVADIEHETVLERGSLISVVERIGGDFMSEIMPRVKLALWATSETEKEFIYLNLPPPGSAPKWSVDLLSDDNLVKLRENLECEKEIAIRVPVVIFEKGKPEVQSFFNIFMKREPASEDGHPIFIREGLIIPKVNCRRARGILSLVVANEEKIAQFLGDAENPAHETWQKDSEHFKGQYTYGSSCLSFIQNSVSELIHILSEKSEGIDPTLLLDIFSIPMPEEGVDRRKPKSKPDSGTKPEIPPIVIPPSLPKRYRVNKIGGGFTITAGDAEVSLPTMLDIRVFYDRRGGKPKYSTADFRIDKDPIKIECHGAEHTCQYNQLQLKVVEPKFSATVRGFDEKRDLFVKVT